MNPKFPVGQSLREFRLRLLEDVHHFCHIRCNDDAGALRGRSGRVRYRHYTPIWSEGNLTRSIVTPGLNVSGEELAATALRGFFRLAGAWRLSEQEQMKLLGLTRCSTLQEWKIGRIRRVPPQTIERISCLLGIFKAINILLPNPTRADDWMRATNNAPPFGGRSALDRMTKGDLGDLHAVRQYLNEQLG